MPAEPDDRIHDDVLQRVVSELRRPVRLDPAVEERALDQIRAEAAGWPASPNGYRWGAWIAGAAIAAGLLLAVVLRHSDQASTLARSSGVEAAAATGDARPVYLQLDAPASSRVAVVGDFNNWDPAATPLRPSGDHGTWVVELRLKPGRYHYTFLIDGRRWERDPREAPAAESDFGAPVSVLTVI
ncbi:MAG TPA: isoamylase early set domain-containing protein [Gemmatimonadales bacterium]|nr:isoamylase early set domain-containing protein [Gemmatimonadales bacterium]